ncbi:hypothetical protein HPP92_013429 [Vanilla planifolia]|uniref:Pulmonary surfactant-associated protein B n=1 Tax=Vanilla planifolia TaxID=51239 RepID=A0A835QZ14_VANPL|nr:hypothetical protein HPP92_013429 [Vanilla planifolia]
MMVSKLALVILGIMVISCCRIEASNVEHLDVMGGQLCQTCQELTTKAVFFLSANETRAEIVEALHEACFNIHSFKQQCMSLLDHYVPLFFLEVSKLQPKLLCQKVKLCGVTSVVDLLKQDNPCTLCHNVINQILTKLDDPDTQIEVIRTLLKVCNQVESYSNQCKKFVLEYGPIILANTEKFFEKTDICSVLHVCKAHKEAHFEQQLLSAAA